MAQEKAKAFELIHFQSSTHRNWFITSISLLILSSIFTGLLFHLPWIKLKYFLWLYLLCMHLGTSLLALIFTKGGRHNHIMYSRDCIWFNVLMAFIYLITMSITTLYLDL